MVSLRTIFLIIRGQYMAGAALRMAKKDIMSLTRAEEANIRASQQMAHYAVFAGGAMIAFGGMVMIGLMKMMEKYGQSSRAMMEFNRVATRAMSNLAKGLIPVIQALTPFVNVLAKILEIPLFAQMFGWGVVFMIVAGGVLFLGGTVLTLVQWLGLLTGSTKLATIGTGLFGKTATVTGQRLMTAYFTGTQVAKAGTDSLVGSVKVASISFLGLFASMGLALGVFFALKNIAGPVGAALIAIAVGVGLLAVQLWMAAGALSVLTFGLAAVAGGAAILGTIAAVQHATSHQMGTSFVKQGGLALLHGGEEIKSARETTAMSKIEKERRGVGAPSYRRTTWHVPITIENVHTKSDVEDLGAKIRRALKDALDKKV